MSTMAMTMDEKEQKQMAALGWAKRIGGETAWRKDFEPDVASRGWDWSAVDAEEFAERLRSETGGPGSGIEGCEYSEWFRVGASKMEGGRIRALALPLMEKFVEAAALSVDARNWSAVPSRSRIEGWVRKALERSGIRMGEAALEEARAAAAGRLCMAAWTAFEKAAERIHEELAVRDAQARSSSRSEAELRFGG